MNVGADPWTLAWACRTASAAFWWLWRIRPRIHIANGTERRQAWIVACGLEGIKAWKKEHRNERDD